MVNVKQINMAPLLESADTIDYLKLKQMVLFTYSTDNLANKDKVKFFYAMNGRNNNPGILAKFESVHFGVTAILAPKKSRDDLILILKKWNILFKMREMLVE